MYTPDHFRMPDTDVWDFVDRIGAGTLISVDESLSPQATFLPWVRVGELTEAPILRTHVAKVNAPAHRPGEALIVVMGEDSYIDDQWMGPSAAPTWDYETVQLRGRLSAHTDPQWIIASWQELLRARGADGIERYDPAWLARQAKAVVGLEFEVREVEAKSKLSQNRPAAQIRTIAAQVGATCPHLGQRIASIGSAHADDRDERVRQARLTVSP
jgi:transcriptional regulator